MRLLDRFDERGVAALEYALVASLMTVVIATAFLAISGRLSEMLSQVCTALGTTC